VVSRHSGIDTGSEERLLKRRRARELALAVLFQIELGHNSPETAVSNVLDDVDDLPEKERAFARSLALGAVRHFDQIDELLSAHTKGWSLERLASTDRNIMRLAVEEMLYHPGIPISVSINEAVELAKIYGEEESGRFVNGVLGSVARDEPVAIE